MKKQNKICIIVTYFGRLPDCFFVFLRSCYYNKNFDFLLVTDQNINFLPNNVNYLKMNLEELKELVKEKLKDERISLEKPYKICDFRPAFGIIFEKYLRGYKFWGHCDIDLILGDLNNFINDNILENYDRILKNGNLSIYRNVDIINNLYKKNGSIYNYKKVFETPSLYAFDEYSGINKICEKNNIKTYCKEIVADIDPKYSRFKLYTEQNYDYQIFYFENGKIIKAYIDDNIVKQKEYSHIHFQKKKIECNLNYYCDKFYITSKGFIEKESIGAPNKETIIKYSGYLGNKFEKKEKLKYIKDKLLLFIKASFDQKIIWLKQKFFVRGKLIK